MIKKIIIITIVVATLFIAGTLFCSAGQNCSAKTTQKEVKGLKMLGVMPSFSLLDYAGNEINSSDFAGKILVVNSWAVWCPFCLDELSDFAKLQEEYSDDIVVIAIDRAESLEKAKGFTDSIGVSDRTVFLMDPRDSFYKNIGGFSMPETIFVDTDGEIRIHKRGPMELSEMRENVDKIINLKYTEL